MKAVTIISRFAGALVVLLVIGAYIAPAGDYTAVLDIPSFALVLALPAGGLFATFGAAAVAGAFASALGFGSTRQRREAELHMAVLARARQFVWAAAALGLLIGLTAIFMSVDSLAAAPPQSFAVAMLPLLYAAIIAEFIIVPLRSALSGRAQGPADMTVG